MRNCALAASRRVASRRVASRREIRGSSHGYARSPTSWAEAACVTNLTPRRYRCAPDSHLRFVPGSCQR